MGESENKLSGFDTFALLVALVLVGLLVWVVYSNFIYVRVPYQKTTCINNLRIIDSAKNQWALENAKTNGTVVTENNIKPCLRDDPKVRILKCPQGGIYKIGKIGEPPTCSLSIAGNPAHVLP